jgi:hypothetical protein
MADGETGSADIGVKEHFNNAITLGIIFILLVPAGMAVGRAIGRKVNAPGMVTYFGGTATATSTS